MNWKGLPCSGRLAWAAQGRQLGLEGCVAFSPTSLIHKKSIALPLGSSKLCPEVGAGSRTALHSALCCCWSRKSKSRGAETAAQRKTSQTRIPSASPGLAPAPFQLQLPEQLLPLLPDCAGTENQSRLKGTSGCDQGTGKGDNSNPLPDETRASRLRGAPRVQRSEEQLVSWAEKGIPQSPFLQQYWWSG